MRLHDRRHAAAVAGLLALTIACCLYTALSAPLGGDYVAPPCRGCDFAGTPIDALAEGHVGRFFATQPFMGSFTLLMRVPAVAALRSLGAGQLVQYRIGCLICLLVAAALLWLMIGTHRRRGRDWGLIAILLGLVLAGPLTTRALFWGHPEELVGAVLCVVAVVLAGRERPLVAGVLLGLALATKQWAVLAILPAVIVSPYQRVRLLLGAGVTAAIFILPMLIGDPARFLAQNLEAGAALTAKSTFGVTATNVWFGYGRFIGANLSLGGYTYVIPAWLGTLTHPLVIVIGLGLPLACWRWVRGPDVDVVLLLLSLVFLLRCLLDPLTLSYHHLPFFAAIVCYETLIRRRLPILSIYSALAIWVLAKWVAPLQDGPLLNKAYLMWAVPVALYLAWRVLAQRPQTGTSRSGVTATTFVVGQEAA